MFGDFVGVDEDDAGQQGRQREGDERRLAGAVGPGDQIEPLHAWRVVFELAITAWPPARPRCRLAGARRCRPRRSGRPW
ncbi:Uncharacterised protein [Mycobacterium tuberculosis]|nr:Uncharacterised protein [Mycobacterium tuberculosis]